MGSRGQTLLDVLLASFVGVSILSGVVFLVYPYAQQFESLLSFARLRVQLFSPMERVQQDLLSAKEVHVDPNRCYVMCLIDATGSRITYYWLNDDLYRKDESASNLLSCAGGKAIAYRLDKPKTSFIINSSLMHVRMAGIDKREFYRLNTTGFPPYRETAGVISLGLACQATNQWKFATTNDTYWEVAGMSGGYVLQANRNLGGNLSESATADVNIDLNGFSKPVLSFEYKNEGNIKDGDYLKVQYWDGSQWNELFSDTTSDNISFRSVNIDLSKQNIGSYNKLRFIGSLTKNPANWSVRNIEIVSR